MAFLNSEKYGENNTYVSILSDKHKQPLASFKSRNSDLNAFLSADAWEYQKLNLGVTYLLFDGEGKAVSYITLGMGALKIPEGQEFEFKGRKLKDYPKVFPTQFPALLIGKLATDENEAGKGAASLLLDYAVKTALEERARIGCAYIVAHVYPESMDWYAKKGFKTYIVKTEGRETIPMYFEL